MYNLDFVAVAYLPFARRSGLQWRQFLGGFLNFQRQRASIDFLILVSSLSLPDTVSSAELRLPQHTFLLEDVSTVLLPWKGGDFIRWRRALDLRFLRFPRNWVDICTFSLLDLGLHTGGALIPSTSIIARTGSGQHFASMHLAGNRGGFAFHLRHILS